MSFNRINYICNLQSLIHCPGGEIGRRTVFRWRRREVCWFESSPGHQIGELRNFGAFLFSYFLVIPARPAVRETIFLNFMVRYQDSEKTSFSESIEPNICCLTVRSAAT